MIGITRLYILAAAWAVMPLIAFPAAAQFSPERYALTVEERTELEQGRDRLKQAIAAIDPMKTTEPRLADVQIYWEALDRNLRQNLFFSKASVEQARKCIAEGISRAEALKDGRTPWLQKRGVLVLGHRSEVDGSIQPYHAYVPAELDQKNPTPYEIFLHGRGGTLNELAFLTGTGWMRSAYGPDTPKHVVIHPYGRGNNGWRWAGMQDVFEAATEFAARWEFFPDLTRIWLRGFSMGGHGAWHLGLHFPSIPAAVSPGAGFVDTVNYQKLSGPFPPFREELLKMWDPIAYAANAQGMNLFPYYGEKDSFASQHKLMAEAFVREGVKVEQIVGPKTGHSYETNALKEVIGSISKSESPPGTGYLLATKRTPDSFNWRFVTYSLRWPGRAWVYITGLKQHWQRAEYNASWKVNTKTLSITTRNITSLTVVPGIEPASIEIDGQSFDASKRHEGQNTYVLAEGKWKLGSLSGLRKDFTHMGPIDDALMSGGMVVRPTGKPWASNLNIWALKEAGRFERLWDMYHRGTLPTATDNEVLSSKADGKNLYLFGDPGSNSVLRKLLPKLPIRWTKDWVEMAGRRYSTSTHLPMMIFPNPDEPGRYVVINCGFTFSEADMQGSNARQFPHLPDWAIIRYDADKFADERDKDTVVAGFFDEQWRIDQTRTREYPKTP